MVHYQNVVYIAEYVSVVSIIVIRAGHGLIPQVRVSLTRSVSHLAYERGEMGTKRCSSNLKSIQGAHGDGVLAGIWAKFRAKDGPNFFFAGHSDIGIEHITSLYLYVI